MAEHNMVTASIELAAIRQQLGNLFLLLAQDRRGSFADVEYWRDRPLPHERGRR